MRTRMIGFFVTAVLMLSGWVPMGARADVIFQDNFERDTVGASLSTQPPQVGSHYDASGKVADTSTSPPGSAIGGGAKFAAATFSAGLGADNRWFLTPGGVTAVTNQVVQFNIDFYLVGDDTSSHAIDFSTFTDGSYDGQAFDVLIFSDGGTLQYYDGTYHTVAGTVATNAWIPVSITANYATDTYHAVVDGISFDADFATAVHSFDSVTAYPDGAGPTFFYDNISITTPEPASIGLLALGGVMLLRRRR